MTSKEVDDAVGERPTLAARAAALRAQVHAPTKVAEELAAVERQLAAEDAADLQQAAERRLLGIVRAVGSLVSAAEQDDVRLLAAAQQWKTALETLNERSAKLVLLRHEAQALAAAFGLAPAELPPIIVSGLRDAVREAVQVIRAVPVMPTGHIDEVRGYDVDRRVFTERTYAELEGTPGYDLLKQRAAGKQPVAV